MRLFLISTGIVLGFVAMTDFAVSEANDERSHARYAVEAKCLDTNTAALPEVQRMCAFEARKAYPQKW
jgi:hypothetical protein